MVSVSEVETEMLTLFPKCPLCCENGGYEVSGFAKNYVQCRSCGAKWWSMDFSKNKPLSELKLMSPSRDGKGESLRFRNEAVKFWQDQESIKNIEVNRTTSEKTEPKTELLFRPEMSDEELESLLVDGLGEINNWDYGSTFFGKGLGTIFSNVSVGEASIIRLLKAVIEENKIMLIQNELLRRQLCKK